MAILIVLFVEVFNNLGAGQWYALVAAMACRWSNFKSYVINIHRKSMIMKSMVGMSG